MKNLFKISVIGIFTMSVLITSCKKSTDEPRPSADPKTGIITCKVNGSVWESDARSKQVSFFDSSYSSVSATVSGDTMSVLAFRSKAGDTSLMMISVLLTSSKLGTYTMTGTDYNIYYFPGISLAAILSTFIGYTASSTLTITKFDAVNKKVSGVFTTTLTPTSSGTTYTVTDGAFTDIAFESR